MTKVRQLKIGLRELEMKEKGGGGGETEKERERERLGYTEQEERKQEGTICGRQNKENIEMGWGGGGGQRGRYRWVERVSGSLII